VVPLAAWREESIEMDFAFGSLLTDAESVPWIPLGPGEAFKPLRFLARNRGRVLLLRLDVGCMVPPHRHTGDVHAFNLEGSRELIDSGRIVKSRDYVYEPAGNADMASRRRRAVHRLHRHPRSDGIPRR
jgi:hypothetical protein